MGRATCLFAFLGALVVSGCLFAACEGAPVGPSLADTPLTSVSLRPTLANDATACCCHVTGVLRNNNPVPVHVTIKFAAFQSSTSPDPFANIVYFVEDLQAGASHNVDAPGFLVPCNAINLSLLRKEISVRGIGSPPF
ncbi:MAG: hypothetical protein IT181_01585 [Acidobacteria bacterium]|nr:hypothetical protein [Acidobacteriota bacterium]